MPGYRDAATYVSISLINQSCAAVLQGSATTMIATASRSGRSQDCGGPRGGVAGGGGDVSCVQPLRWSADGWGVDAVASMQRPQPGRLSDALTTTAGVPCIVASSTYMSNVFEAAGKPWSRVVGHRHLHGASTTHFTRGLGGDRPCQ